MIVFVVIADNAILLVTRDYFEAQSCTEQNVGARFEEYEI